MAVVRRGRWSGCSGNRIHPGRRERCGEGLPIAVGFTCSLRLANSIGSRYQNLGSHLHMALAKSSVPRPTSHLQVRIQGQSSSPWGCHQGVINPSLVIYPGCDCKHKKERGEWHCWESRVQMASAGIWAMPCLGFLVHHLTTSCPCACFC